MSGSRFKRALADTREYNSDEDLSSEEQRRIQYAANPDKAREAIWEKKPVSDKFSKTLKTIWYGDRTKKADTY